jgi:hypothetical protein
VSERRSITGLFCSFDAHPSGRSSATRPQPMKEPEGV